MKMRGLNQTGLSLPEVMVSVLVGAIIAGTVLSVLSMQNAALSDGTTNAAMQMQTGAVADQIGRSVHMGNMVLAPGETWSATPSFTSARDTNVIRVYNDTGRVFAAYRDSARYLQESSNGTLWRNFSTGGAVVTVTSTSSFHLSGDRKEVTLNQRLTTTYKGRRDTANVLGDMYRCRN
jgi:prepilin-type N-terminal cleavage/methylation domain-containing protein